MHSLSVCKEKESASLPAFSARGTAASVISLLIQGCYNAKAAGVVRITVAGVGNYSPKVKPSFINFLCKITIFAAAVAEFQ